MVVIIRSNLGRLGSPSWSQSQAKQHPQPPAFNHRQHAIMAERTSHPASQSRSSASCFAVLTGAAAQAEVTLESEPSKLQTFLHWLQANGAQGVDNDAKVSIYTDDEGGRGMLFTADVAEDEVLLRIPLRLAVVSHADDKEINAALGRDSAYDERLAWKLLQHVQRGPGSPLHPFIQILPERINSPHDAWQPSCSQNLQLWGQAEDLQHVLHYGAGSNFPGGFSHEQIRWALAVVHSRSFYTPVESGGMGICMLVPMADMFNHGGDVADFRLAGSSTATDNTKWRLVPPDEEEGWSFIISASRAAEAGEEALFSYGEKPSWHFFLSYGFVPPRNPHEEVVLFNSTEEAVGWFLHRIHPLMKVQSTESDLSRTGPPEEGQSEADLMATALAAAARKELPLHDSLANHVLAVAEIKALKLTAKGELDERLIAAFSSLVSQAPPHDKSDSPAGIRVDAELVVGLRLLEMLYSPNVTSLPADLMLLSRLESVDLEERQYFLALLKHYTEVIHRVEKEIGNKTLNINSISILYPVLRNDKLAGMNASKDLDESGVLALRLRASLKQVMWEGVHFWFLNRL